MLIRVDKEILNRPATNVATPRVSGNAGTVYDARRKSIYEMADIIEQTVRYSNGQVVERVVKAKELRMTRFALEKLLLELTKKQEDRCALTGIPFSFRGNPNCDKELLPSPDRIDSNGHYEPSNLQIVCRFVNFWKSDSDNGEFLRLLALVRGIGDDDACNLTTPLICDWRITTTGLAVTLGRPTCCSRLATLFPPAGQLGRVAAGRDGGIAWCSALLH
jgi:hypothetical protein